MNDQQYHSDYNAKWNKAHPEKRKEYQRRYRQKPEYKERNKLAGRKWREENPEKSRASALKYYYEHREEIRQQHRAENQRLKINILTYYGKGKCACVHCRESRPACLSIDHIEGGGLRHFKTIGTGTRFYWWLKRNGYPEGYQTLCMNCQWVKREMNNECARN